MSLLAMPVAARAQDVADVRSQTNDSPASDASSAPASLLDVPLEDLLTIESTSVAKKRQRVSESTASVYVITQDEIRRSAAPTIPDLLRGVPGVEVGRLANGGYAVSIRGFNSRLTNSLLVMVDGRSQFISTISGVFWDQLMVPMSDIERIEVVRGPGAALWGANSSNGVINIITKHSADSGGTAVDVRGGLRQQDVSISHGSRLSDTLSYRAYGSYRHDDGLIDEQGGDIGKRWAGGSGGLRVDFEPDERNAYTVQAEYGEGKFDTPFRLPSTNLFAPGYFQFQAENAFKSFNVLGRWTRRQSDNLDWSLQAQYNRLNRTEFGGVGVLWQLADIDLGLHWRASEMHDVSFGVGARLLHDDITQTPYVRFDNLSATDRWISGYLQDDITLIPEMLRLTLGTKVENNNFTGFEVQPSARVFLRPAKHLSLWGAISRAVRTPSRFERNAHLALFVTLPRSPNNPTPLPVYTTLNGVNDRNSEVLIAYEAGARVNLSGNWSLDVAGFYNNYKSLTVNVPKSTKLIFVPNVPFPVGIQADVDFQDSGTARTWGGEVTLAGNVTPWWKATLNYSHFNFELGIDPSTGARSTLLFPLGYSPRHQFALRNNFDIGDAFSIDTQLRHVGRLEQGNIPAYTTADLRLTYRLPNGAELSLVGTNLLHARHIEFNQQDYPAPQAFVSRAVSGQLRYRF
ncbi:TonB-dependent receptor [Novosphingobium sp. SL115]|uniref:TonB-dependent receptor plug domain-containing protein n=1 Tax=Novosphingobium sp. SL115 TaxID=2995150 RepID=UPI002274F9A5|nr:TonB-dependent receptor [Novosphingobium sp. SL115]MCY1669422.1 TonB-dependent receptor [Novosphingobium sp. SL115]